VKFTSFNIFGTNTQSLSDVEPYEFTIRGIALNYPPNPINNETLMTYYTDNKLFVEWGAVYDERNIYYEIRKGSSWNNSVVVGKTDSTKFQFTSSGTYWIATAFDGTDKTYIRL
jgi:hypothetical protein